LKVVYNQIPYTQILYRILREKFLKASPDTIEPLGGTRGGIIKVLVN
jgi:hypothetical protein